MGARICIGQRPENLQDAQVVVISSAIRETNPELQEARRRGIPVIHRSDALVHIMSWGKTVTPLTVAFPLIAFGAFTGDVAAPAGAAAVTTNAAAKALTNTFFIAFIVIFPPFVFGIIYE